MEDFVYINIVSRSFLVSHGLDEITWEAHPC